GHTGPGLRIFLEFSWPDGKVAQGCELKGHTRPSGKSTRVGVRGTHGSELDGHTGPSGRGTRKNVVLNSSHIVSFFDDCLERYHKITGWKRRNKGGKKRNHGQKNKSLSSNDCHRIDSPDPGALSAGEPERKAALLESVNDANRLSHSANVEEEPLPPEDVKPSCMY
ncbi:hypothetical protein Y032_0668g1342, partial [Ancylostoma ceylanicum]